MKLVGHAASTKGNYCKYFSDKNLMGNRGGKVILK
jgi:hypothetical protein